MHGGSDTIAKTVQVMSKGCFCQGRYINDSLELCDVVVE